MAMTTDFTGTYDYEQYEAKDAAGFILDDLSCGVIQNTTQFKNRIELETKHWQAILTDTYADFELHFNEYINQGLINLYAEYVKNIDSLDIDQGLLDLSCLIVNALDSRNLEHVYRKKTNEEEAA